MFVGVGNCSGLMQQVFQTILMVTPLNWRVYTSPDTWKLCRAPSYQYQPYSVTNVSSLVAVIRGRLWYPFHVSSMVFFIQTGTIDAWLNGDGVWCVSLTVAALRFCKSTVHLGVTSFFSCNHHSWAPGCRCTYRHWLNYAQWNIPVNVLFDLLLQMMWN